MLFRDKKVTLVNINRKSEACFWGCTISFFNPKGIPVKFRRILILAVLAPLLFAAPKAAQGASKPLMIHYMPWFVSKPYSGYWGWHWTMNHFNPDVINANGQREIASWYYP